MEINSPLLFREFLDPAVIYPELLELVEGKGIYEDIIEEMY